MNCSARKCCRKSRNSRARTGLGLRYPRSIGVMTNDSSIQFTERTVTAGNVSVMCREAGAGLPLVFLETLEWGHRRFYAALARQFHLFILHFEAARVEGAETAVREIARTLAGDTYSLAGSSQGANLALRTLLRAPAAPEPVEALALIAPTAVRPDPNLPSLNPSGWSDRLMAHPERQSSLAGLPEGSELADLLLPNDSDADLESRLPEIGCPTLAVFGSRDRLIAREAPATYRANIPNCHISLIYDTGHLIAPERPEALANVVIDFIENRETFVVSRQRSVINP